MRVRSALTVAAVVAAGLALAACGDHRGAESAAPPAQVEVTDESAAVTEPTAASASAEDAAEGIPSEPVPYDQMRGDQKKAPAQKADAENENVFY